MIDTWFVMIHVSKEADERSFTSYAQGMRIGRDTIDRSIAGHLERFSEATLHSCYSSW